MNFCKARVSANPATAISAIFGGGRQGYCWDLTASEITFHGGRAKVRWPRVREKVGKEVGLERWEVPECAIFFHSSRTTLGRQVTRSY